MGSYVRDERPWGFFERLTNNEPTTVKLITVRRGECLSLQMHAKRDEYWRVISGRGVATVGDAMHSACAGDEFYIPRTTAHRAEAATDEDFVFLELAFGDFDENDIVRIEDSYGRAISAAHNPTHD